MWKQRLLRGTALFPSRAFVISFPIIEKSHVVKTKPLAKQLWIGRMALRICDAAIDRRKGNGMPIGLWWSLIEPRVGRVSGWLPILGS